MSSESDTVWATCERLGSDYEVSSAGQVRRRTPGQGVKNRGKPLFQYPAGKGKTMRINVRGRSYAVHRLVLETFVGPCPPDMEGCHNDGNNRNNHVSNLRWDTHAANMQDANRHGTSRVGLTHCKQGHPYSLANTRVRPGRGGRPRRDCITCSRNRAAIQSAQRSAMRTARRQALNEAPPTASQNR